MKIKVWRATYARKRKGSEVSWCGKVNLFWEGFILLDRHCFNSICSAIRIWTRSYGDEVYKAGSQEAMKSQEQLKEQHDFHEQSRDGPPVNVKLLTVVLIKAELSWV